MQPVDLTPGHETREVFWNTVNYQIPLDIFALISLAIFGYGLYKRYQLWMAVGKPEFRKDNMVRGSRPFSITAFFSCPSGVTPTPASCTPLFSMPSSS